MGALGRVGGGFALLAKAVHAGAKLWSRTHAHVRGNEKEGIRRCTCGVQLWTQQYHRPMERKSAGSQCCSRWKQALQEAGRGDGEQQLHSLQRSIFGCTELPCSKCNKSHMWFILQPLAGLSTKAITPLCPGIKSRTELWRMWSQRSELLLY